MCENHMVEASSCSGEQSEEAALVCFFDGVQYWSIVLLF